MDNIDMDILTQIGNHINNTAKQKGLIAGPKVEDIELQSDIIYQFADRIFEDFKKLRPIKDLDDVRKDLIRGFVYMFDKGVNNPE
jgi:hypothetical protein